MFFDGPGRATVGLGRTGGPAPGPGRVLDGLGRAISDRADPEADPIPASSYAARPTEPPTVKGFGPVGDANLLSPDR